MKKRRMIFMSLLMLSGLVFFPGCEDKDPITGTLTVVVLDYVTGLPVIGEQVFLATSYENLKNRAYTKNGWTNVAGAINFGELPPLIYFVDTENWQNWLATQVYAGYDDYVVLYVNYTGSKMK